LHKCCTWACQACLGEGVGLACLTLDALLYLHHHWSWVGALLQLLATCMCSSGRFGTSSAILWSGRLACVQFQGFHADYKGGSSKQWSNTCLRARGKFKTMVQCRARYRSVESVTLLDSGGPAVSQGQCMAQKTEGGCIAGGLAGYMMKVGDHTEITVIRAWCSANQSERSQVSY
jgi:hypothetical protein